MGMFVKGSIDLLHTSVGLTATKILALRYPTHYSGQPGYSYAHNKQLLGLSRQPHHARLD